MAFSTQKDFFDVPFMNESFQMDCKKACVKLKSYESTTDSRAWSRDETKQSNFLSDLITCRQHPSSLAHGEVEADAADDNDSKGASTSKDSQKTTTQSDDHFKNLSHEEMLSLQLGGDSLLECANLHLSEYQKILKANIAPEKQSEISNERHKTANQANEQIREALAGKLDSNTAKDFYNKIQKFTAAGKFNKNEENVMLQIYQKMENMYKAYENLQAENNYLKRLTEKLTMAPEASADTSQRQTEDDHHKLKQQQTNYLARISEQDAENIKAIIKERNSLREKCKSLKVLEQQVKELEHKTQESKTETADLCKTLSKKMEYINEMEVEMHNMQKYYEEKCQNACLREECLKAQLRDLKEELIKAKCDAQKADILCMEVSSLRNELLKRDLSLNEYDCQYKQLMDVVDELQSVKLQCLQDNQTQTQACIDQTDELTFYTCATLNEITKELKKRGCFNDKFSAVQRLEQAPGSSYVEHDKKCCQEVERLQQKIAEMEKEMQKEFNTEMLSEDLRKRLKEVEAENAKLLQYNQLSNEKLKETEAKMINMLQKMDEFDKDIGRNSQETNQIGKDLQGAIDLVKDISEVQLKNQQLANAVTTINSRDDEKIIEDLRRQLEEEMDKLKKCQQNYTNLLEESKLREMDLKHLKEINNKLIQDNANLKKILNLTHSEDNADDVVDITDEISKQAKNPSSHTPSKDTMSKTTHQPQQEVIMDLDELVTSTPKNAASKQSSRFKQESASLDESVAYPLQDAGNKRPSPSQQEAVGLDAHVTSPSEDVRSRTQSQIKQEVTNLNESITSSLANDGNIQPIRNYEDVVGVTEFVTSPLEHAGNIQSIQRQEEPVGLVEFATYPFAYAGKIRSIQRQQAAAANVNELEYADSANMQTIRSDQEILDLDEYITSPSKTTTNKIPRRAQQKLVSLDELLTSPSEDVLINARNRINQQIMDLDDFSTSPSKDFFRKQTSQSHQKSTDLYELPNPPSKEAGSKLIKRVQQKDVDLHAIVKSPSKPLSTKQSKPVQQNIKFMDNSRSDPFNKQLRRDHQKATVSNENETSKRKELTKKQLHSEQQKGAVLDDFVNRKSDNLKHNLQIGRGFEKEFRNILEEFIIECSNCFCGTFNMKSKLYEICHRLCHRGIDKLTFRELAYLHRKIYAQADHLVPGCLLDMILSEHKDRIEQMLSLSGISNSVDNKEIDCKLSHETITSVDGKCCCCKNELCCNYSEEMLKDKVNKLEKDIGIAREYLETLRNIPLETNVPTDNCDSSDTNNSTYRASTSVMIEKKSRYSKHLKKLKKSCMIKHPAI